MEEVAKYESGQGQGLIDVAKDPERVLIEAKKAAEALVRVVSSKPTKVIINNEQYLEFEDWQTLGRFYGLTVRVDSSEPVNFDGIKGWQAKASVINRNGDVVSSADAMCLSDEEKWSTRSKYEYQYIWKNGKATTENPPTDQIIWIPNPKKPGKSMPKKERTKVSDEQVPFFQLRSMAQTRASAKAFRNVLAWVVVLAGYKPTPAEEMPSPDPQDYAEHSPLPGTPSSSPAEESQKSIICPKSQMDIDESECEHCDQITSCTAMGKAEEPPKEAERKAPETKANGNYTVCRKVGKEIEGYKVYTRYCQTTCKERKTCVIAQGLK